MPDSVYKIIELVGSSPVSWEKAAENAITKAAETLQDLRVAEVTKMDLHIKDGKIEFYRTKLKVSFKYKGH
ncbi:MAG TPA: dodecin family protein [Prolixibacteraceae bacterium]|nr:dodecin family protein [Prolixibacteraceae bacterium]